jgi:hypothetical protein
MGKKPQQRSWPEAIRLCRLNRNDIEMAKRLGFRPDALIRARPGPKHKWKLPVNEWVRELYRERFGHMLGKKALPAPVPAEVELDQEAMRPTGSKFSIAGSRATSWSTIKHRPQSVRQDHCAKLGSMFPRIRISPEGTGS